MRFRDSFSLAARTIKSNKLRAYITIAIIAFGIMALIGIITAIQAMEQKFAESFSSMGANGFSIRFKEPRNFMAPRTSTEVTRTGRKERRSSEGKPITLEQAESFKKNYPFPALVSISLDGRGNATVTGNGKKTNPTVRISGGDENYVSLNGYEITVGRGLNERDVESGQNVCVIGADVAKTIFGGVTPSGLDKTIIVNSIPYRVIGILDPKGATFGFSRDNL
ncbi:MAG TPA: ABC transporter permease, partial [Parasegetibacter sp.]